MLRIITINKFTGGQQRNDGDIYILSVSLEKQTNTDDGHEGAERDRNQLLLMHITQDTAVDP